MRIRTCIAVTLACLTMIISPLCASAKAPPVCQDSTLPTAQAPYEDIPSHRQFTVPAIGYPFDYKKKDDVWGMDLELAVDPAGHVICYQKTARWEGSPGPVDSYERKIIAELGAWHYAPFIQDGRATAVMVLERVNEYERPEHHVPLPEVPLENVHIRLQRYGCIFNCPAYSVDIYGDGRVVYDGQGSVDVTGSHTYRITPSDVKTLVDSLRATDLWSLTAGYQARITDQSMTTITVDMGSAHRQLTDYVGEMAGMPATVTAFENQIDKVAGVMGWLQLSQQAMTRLEAEAFDFTSQAGGELLLAAVSDHATDNDAAIEALLNHNAPISAISTGTYEGSESGSVLEIALKRRRSPVVDILINRGALQTAGQDDQTKLDEAFRAAIVGGKLDLVQKIWMASRRGMHPALVYDDMSLTNRPPVTGVPVTLLLLNNYDMDHWQGLDIAKWLHSLGCDLGTHSADGTTLLHIAAHANDDGFVHWLLSEGVDPSAPGKYGPAIQSTTSESVAMTLLEAGTDLSTSADKGAGFRRYAQNQHWDRVVAWLDAHPAAST